MRKVVVIGIMRGRHCDRTSSICVLFLDNGDGMIYGLWFVMTSLRHVSKIGYSASDDVLSSSVKHNPKSLLMYSITTTIYACLLLNAEIKTKAHFHVTILTTQRYHKLQRPSTFYHIVI